MKAVLINGSPRKNWNTHQLLNSAMHGAESAGAEAELFHLSDYNVKGCYSCFACKRKGNSTNGVCAVSDELRPVLQQIMDADVLIIGSPIYFGNLTAATMAILERIEYPVLNYKPALNGVRPRTLPKEKQTGWILDMNCPEKDMEQRGYTKRISDLEKQLSGIVGNGEYMTVFSCDTYQFSNYEEYDAPVFNEQKKRRHHELQFPTDLKNAYELGRMLVENAKSKQRNEGLLRDGCAVFLWTK